jgi:superfamily I DNA/RNA helicase
MNTQEFTQEQQAILRLIEGQHIVLAPPGSGKTQLHGCAMKV